MSTFLGPILENPHIRIDRFTDTSDEAMAYFLSHAHTDHMHGLETSSFRKHIEQSGKKLYCTPVTKILLQFLPSYSSIASQFIALPIDDPTYIDVSSLREPNRRDGSTDEDDSSWITVTLIPAGHCPGSVMFLFESSLWRALYTGDFRLDVGSAKKVSWFHTSSGKVKPVDTVYCDTTFFTPHAHYLRSRQESNTAILNEIRYQLDKDKNCVILIKTGARFGYENMYWCVKETLGYEVKVSENVHACYSLIPEIARTVTRNSNTRIYSGRSATDVSIPQGVRIKVIRLSTMFFIIRKVKSVTFFEKYKNGGRVTRICYSSHSSMEEVADLVRYLQPKKAFPNAPPIGLSLEQAEVLLEQLLVHSHHGGDPDNNSLPFSCPDHLGTSENEPKEVVPQWKGFGVIKCRGEGLYGTDAQAVNSIEELSDSESDYATTTDDEDSEDERLLFSQDITDSRPTTPGLAATPVVAIPDLGLPDLEAPRSSHGISTIVPCDTVNVTDRVTNEGANSLVAPESVKCEETRAATAASSHEIASDSAGNFWPEELTTKFNEVGDAMCTHMQPADNENLEVAENDLLRLSQDLLDLCSQGATESDCRSIASAGDGRKERKDDKPEVGGFSAASVPKRQRRSSNTVGTVPEQTGGEKSAEKGYTQPNRDCKNNKRGVKSYASNSLAGLSFAKVKLKPLANSCPKEASFRHFEMNGSQNFTCSADPKVADLRSYGTTSQSLLSRDYERKDVDDEEDCDSRCSDSSEDQRLLFSQDSNNGSCRSSSPDMKLLFSDISEPPGSQNQQFNE